MNRPIIMQTRTPNATEPLWLKVLGAIFVAAFMGFITYCLFSS
jgi:hypothetical protein